MDVVFKDELDEQLSDHNVVTTDSLPEDIENSTDIVDLVIDQIEITRK